MKKEREIIEECLDKAIYWRKEYQLETTVHYLHGMIITLTVIGISVDDLRQLYNTYRAEFIASLEGDTDE